MDNPFDSTLTVKNVVNSLRAVTRWYELGIQLEIEYSELEKIRNDRRDTDLCKVAMVCLWIERAPSWQKLCDALKNLEQVHIAEQIEKHDFPELKRRQEEKETREAEALQRDPSIYVHQRLEEDRYEERSTVWEVKNEQMQLQHKESMENARQAAFSMTTPENAEKIIRDILRKHEIGWVYDAITQSAVDRKELELLKERMEVQTEGSKIFKDRVKEIKKKKVALAERAQNFEELEVGFDQDQDELKLRQRRLEKLNFWGRWWTYRNDVSECQDKLHRCQERLGSCRNEIQKCKQEVERLDIQLSDCHFKVKSCISELCHLREEHQHCDRSVTGNILKIQETVPILKTILFDWTAWGVKAGATAGAVAGTMVLPGVGTAVGGVVGGVVGFAAGVAIDDLQRKMVEEGLTDQLKRCGKEVTECQITLYVCRGVAEETTKEIGELEHLVQV